MEEYHRLLRKVLEQGKLTVRVTPHNAGASRDLNLLIVGDSLTWGLFGTTPRLHERVTAVMAELETFARERPELFADLNSMGGPGS